MSASKQTLADLRTGDRFVVDVNIFGGPGGTGTTARLITHGGKGSGCDREIVSEGLAWDARTGAPCDTYGIASVCVNLDLHVEPGFGRARVALPGEIEKIDEEAERTAKRYADLRKKRARAEAEQWVEVAERVASMPLRERVMFLKSIAVAADLADLLKVARAVGGAS